MPRARGPSDLRTPFQATPAAPLRLTPCRGWTNRVQPPYVATRSNELLYGEKRPSRSYQSMQPGPKGLNGVPSSAAA